MKRPVVHILGIDPGSRFTGWGILAKDSSHRIRAVDYGLIKLPPKEPLAVRLKLLYEQLRDILTRYQPQHAAVESIFHAVNAQSALKLGHVRGVVLLAFTQFGCELHEIAPTEVKKSAVGYGRASKEQVQQMVSSLLALPEIPPTDTADALAVALAASNRAALPIPRRAKK